MSTRADLHTVEINQPYKEKLCIRRLQGQNIQEGNDQRCFVFAFHFFPTDIPFF